MDARTFAKRSWYRLLRGSCRFASVVLLQVRCRGTHLVPPQGGALLLSNHQSHLDPMLIAVACDRPLSFVARQTLFRFSPFRWLIKSLDAIPIDREGSGLGGLKETLRRLRRDEAVLLFPEGTRSDDGEVAPLKPGFCALAKRAGVPLVPVAVEGAFRAWPKTRLLPRPGRVVVEFGQPIMLAEIDQLDERALLAEVERRIRSCHESARAYLRRTL